jgi:hypothetical protein
MNAIMALMGAVLLAGSAGANGPADQRCGTRLWPGDIDRMRSRLTAGAYDFLASPQDTVYVPLTFHIVRTSGGQGGLSAAKICTALDDLDAFFASAGIQFYLAGPLDFIDDDAFFYDIDTPEEIDALRRTNPVAGTINLYFTAHLANGHGEFCGISSFSWSRVQGIVMHNDCTAVPWNHTTLPHEMGHYFDLLHTHETARDRECVDGSNCEAAGDQLCDTPADPGLGAGNVDADCVYVGTETDPCHGDRYVPDETNLLSGSPPPCRSSFTPQQRAKELATLFNLRPELVHFGPPGPYDCNDNGTRDDCDMARGTSEDLNRNGIPDECDPAGDIDGDGDVDVDDFVPFSACQAGPDVTEPPPDCDPAVFALSDLDDDGDVDLRDFAILQDALTAA